MNVNIFLSEKYTFFYTESAISHTFAALHAFNTFMDTDFIVRTHLSHMTDERNNLILYNLDY